MPSMRSQTMLVVLVSGWFSAQTACGGSGDAANGDNAGPGGVAGASGTSTGGASGKHAGGTSGAGGEGGHAGDHAGTAGTTSTGGSSGASGTSGSTGSSGAAGSSSGSGGAAGDSSFGGASTTGGAAGTTTNDPVISIAIEPQNAVIFVSNGAVPPATAYTATGTTQNGMLVPVNGSWTFDRPQAGTMDLTSGSLTATGLMGGTGQVKFTAVGSGLSATTGATITLQYLSDPENIDPGIKGLFPGATQDDPSMSLVYPYDQTMFPRGIPGPVIQWNGGGGADIYNVKITSPGLELDAWATVAAPGRFSLPTVPADMWKLVTESNLGSVDVTVQRYDGSQAYAPKSQTWNIAGANLGGTVYYWEVNNGNVVRLNIGDSAPQDFLQKPAGHTCVACHSLSANGQRIVAAFDGGASPWATFDAASGTMLFSSETPSGFEAISPDGQYVLSRHWVDGGFNSGGFLSLTTFDNTAELAQLNPGGGAPSHPRWSVDGKKIAFSVRTDGTGLDFNTSTLWMADVDTTIPSISNLTPIVANDASRTCVTFPSFTPDSQWVVFERSNQARSRAALSDLSLTNTDGSIIVSLDNANGTGQLQAPEASANYEPTVMPIAAGGYYWVVMVSERTYGNTLTNLDPNTRQKQLWVFAVDANPMAGVDPSHKPFWLPGQALNNQNMRGEWTLPPCKSEGATCAAGYDCCSGFCVDSGSGPVCAPPQTCSNINDACTQSSDCCDDKLSCVGGFCTDL